MIRHIRPPRLLPVTIAALAIVLVSKSAMLLQSVIASEQPAAFIAAAWAAGTDAPASVEKPADKPAARPGDYGQPIKPRAGTENKAGGPDASTCPELPPVPEGPPPMTDSEKSLLLELRERRQELDARDVALANRESLLVAAEAKLSARVAELQDLQQRLESLDASHRQQENAAWQSLVKIYEAMKPRDAATIFNDLEMPVLLPVVDRMKEAKTAAILAAMLPDKARDVTTRLADFRTKAAAAVDTGGKPPQPAKPSGAGT